VRGLGERRRRVQVEFELLKPVFSSTVCAALGKVTEAYPFGCVPVAKMAQPGYCIELQNPRLINKALHTILTVYDRKVAPLNRM
jgi:hypothetical protein